MIERMLVEDAEMGERIPYIEHDFLSFDDLDRERLNRYFSYLQRRISDPTRYMDKGGAGYVFNVNDSICLKVIEDRARKEELRAKEEGRVPHRLDLGNDPYTEARIQESLSRFTVSGVRSPILIQYLEGELWHGLAMEKLSARNLEHCLSGSARLPESFDHGRFMDSLGNYLNELHESKGVAHNDLEARNVMVDESSGLPVVIDFGRSLRQGTPAFDKATKKDWEDYDKLEERLKV